MRFPLDSLFSASSHIPILRTLQECREGMSGRAIAREARINHQTCAVAIKNLESLGILQRQGSGHTQLIRLNFENYLVNYSILPLLKQERELFKRIRNEIVISFKDVLVITIFGSTARGQEKMGSDIDVLFVVHESKKNKILNKITDYTSTFIYRFGVRLSPIVLTVDEVKLRIKRSDPLLKNILSDGISLTPKKLQDLI